MPCASSGMNAPCCEMSDAMREPICFVDLRARHTAPGVPAFTNFGFALMRPALALFLAFAAGGCGSDEGPGAGGPTPVDDVGGGTGDVGGVPEFTPCADNLDCAGGEVCRDEVCRVACESNGDCGGLTPVCDPSSQLCTGCVATSDCGGGERCRDGFCQAFCRGPEDCAGDQVCATSTGSCVDPQCTANRDCAGGEVCRAGLCRPFDDPVCTPGASRCVGSTLVRCSDDGRREVETPCEAPTICEDTGSSAQCFDPSCDPFSIGCVDDETAFVCNATGDGRDLLACRSDQRCDAGQCVRRVCSPGAVTCDGADVRVCNEDGTGFRVVDCDTFGSCASSPFGCTCSAGTCAERRCEPGRSECVGPGTRSCDDDGLTIGSVTACGEDEGCFGGVCESLACTPGSVRCSGSVLLTCDGSGEGYTTRDCRDEGAFCDGASGTPTCTSRVCTPGQAICNTAGTAVLACNASGSEQTTQTCATGQYCEQGRCLDRICTPGNVACRGGNVSRCNAAGSAWQVETACGSGTVCRDAACVAETNECTQSNDCVRAGAECDGNTLVTRSPTGSCVSGTCAWGAGETRVACGTNERCDATVGACVARPVPCTTNANCTSSQECIDSVCVPRNPLNCTTDAECVALAGTSPSASRAVCDPRVGCMIPGLCNADLSTVIDPFDAPCLPGQTCAVDLLGGIIDNEFRGRCGTCSTEQANTCRRGEACTTALLTGEVRCTRATDGSGGGSPPFPFP